MVAQRVNTGSAGLLLFATCKTLNNVRPNVSTLGLGSRCFNADYSFSVTNLSTLSVFLEYGSYQTLQLMSMEKLGHIVNLMLNFGPARAGKTPRIMDNGDRLYPEFFDEDFKIQESAPDFQQWGRNLGSLKTLWILFSCSYTYDGVDPWVRNKKLQRYGMDGRYLGWSASNPAAHTALKLVYEVRSTLKNLQINSQINEDFEFFSHGDVIKLASILSNMTGGLSSTHAEAGNKIEYLILKLNRPSHAWKRRNHPLIPSVISESVHPDHIWSFQNVALEETISISTTKHINKYVRPRKGLSVQMHHPCPPWATGSHSGVFWWDANESWRTQWLEHHVCLTKDAAQTTTNVEYLEGFQGVWCGRVGQCMCAKTAPPNFIGLWLKNRRWPVHVNAEH